MAHSKTNLSGIILMLQGAFAFSLMALCVKFASKTLPSLEIVFFRSFFGVLMISALLIKKRVSPWGTKRKLLILRGVSGFIALSLHFYTISHLPLGTAMLINYTSPIFSAILAILFLKERPGAIVLSMIAVAFLGVDFLIGVKFSGWSTAIMIGLLSAVFAAIAYVLIRAIKHRESPLTIIFYFTGISTIGSILYLPFGFVWPEGLTWLALAGVGLGSFFGQLWMTIALRRTPASIVSPFSYLAPLLTFVYGFIFFDERLSKSAIFGIFLIVLAGCVISVGWKKKTLGASR